MKHRKKKQKGAPEMSSGEALVAIADGSPEALKMVGDIMDANERAHISQLEDQLVAEKREHGETRALLNEVRYLLHDMHERVGWLLGGPVPASLRVEIEGIIEDEVSEVELRVR